MTMLFVLGTMAQQRHRVIFGEMLEETQGEFLAVILDSLIAAIDRAALAQLFPISLAVLRPGDFPRQKFIPELLARAEVCHPDMVKVFRQAPSSAARRENSQAVLKRLDPGVNGLGFDHG